MKKSLCAVLAIFTIFAMTMVGCDNGSSTKTEFVKVTFDWNGGTVASGVSATRDVEKGKAIGALPTVTPPTGKTLDKWVKADGTTEVTAATTFSANETIKALWKDTGTLVDPITITFDWNGGTVATGVAATKEIEKGAAIGTLPTVTPPTGKKLDKWVKADGTTEVTATTTFDADATIKVLWQDLADPVEITFDYNGGTKATGAPDKVTIEKGEKLSTVITKLPDVTPPTDKELDKWVIKGATTEVTVDSTFTADTTIQAVWKDKDEGTEPTEVIETVSLSNGAFVMYKFTLPAGKTWADVTKLTATYRFDEESRDKTVAQVRVMGNYKEADFNFTSVQGPEAGDKFRNYATLDLYNPAGLQPGNANTYNGPFILCNENNAKGWKYLSDDDPIEADVWTVVNYDISGAKAHGQFTGNPGNNQNLPAATDTGPFILGIGFAGQGWGNPANDVDDGSIVQEIKDIALVLSDNTKVAAVQPFTGFQAFLANGPYNAETNSDIPNLWRGSDAWDADELEPPTWADDTVTITFDGNAPSDGGTLTLAETSREISKGGLLAGKDTFASKGSLPTPTLSGPYKFVGWATTDDATTPNVNPMQRYSADKTVYAIWEDDAVPPPTEDLILVSADIDGPNDAIDVGFLKGFGGLGGVGNAHNFGPFTFSATASGETDYQQYDANLWFETLNLGYDKIDITYTVEILDNDDHAAYDSLPAKISFHAGRAFDAWSGGVSQYKDAADGTFTCTYNVSDAANGLVIQHNRGSAGSTTSSSFKLTITEIKYYCDSY